MFIDCSFCVSSTFRMFTHIFLFSLSPPVLIYLSTKLKVLPICPHTPKVDFHAALLLCFLKRMNIRMGIRMGIRNVRNSKSISFHKMHRKVFTHVSFEVFVLNESLIAPSYCVSNIKLQLWILLKCLTIHNSHESNCFTIYRLSMFSL